MTPNGDVINGSDLGPIRDAYTQFWGQIVQLTGGKAKSISGEDFDVSYSEADGAVNVKTKQNGPCFRFKDIHDRGHGGTSELEAFVELDQWIQLCAAELPHRYYEVSHGVVRLQYLIHRDSASEAISRGDDPLDAYVGMHFDQVPGETNHPLFHVQFTDNCISMAAVGRSYRQSRNVAVCRVPRVPTAPIEFAGIVYMLLHDHLPDTVKNGWPASVLPSVSRLPRAAHPSFVPHLPATALLRPEWWYLHGGHGFPIGFPRH